MVFGELYHFVTGLRENVGGEHWTLHFSYLLADDRSCGPEFNMVGLALRGNVGDSATTNVIIPVTDEPSSAV